MSYRGQKRNQGRPRRDSIVDTAGMRPPYVVVQGFPIVYLRSSMRQDSYAIMHAGEVLATFECDSRDVVIQGRGHVADRALCILDDMRTKAA